jgi:uncharacterized damage-inducible protein DinB
MSVVKLIQFWDQVRRGLLTTLNKFSDEELDFAAFEGGYSVKETLLHIAQEELGEIHYGITGTLSEFPPAYEKDAYPTSASITALLEAVHSDTLSILESFDDEDLFQQVELGWGGTQPMIDLIWHLMEHEIHHRGELSLMLGLLGREGLDA